MSHIVVKLAYGVAKYRSFNLFCMLVVFSATILVQGFCHYYKFIQLFGFSQRLY